MAFALECWQPRVCVVVKRASEPQVTSATFTSLRLTILVFCVDASNPTTIVCMDLITWLGKGPAANLAQNVHNPVCEGKWQCQPEKARLPKTVTWEVVDALQNINSG